MTPERVAEIRAMLAAASPGPWRWGGDTYVRGTELVRTGTYGTETVMGARRLGMQAAQVAFTADMRIVRSVTDGLVVLEAPYRNDIADINHPDARLIAAAPAVIAELLAALDEAFDAGFDEGAAAASGRSR